AGGVGDVRWSGDVWTCWEAVRTLVFPYYPAAVLALSQDAMPPVLQVASVGGISGVTFILVACNVGVASLLGSSFRLVPGSRPTRAAITGIALAVAAVGWGMVRLSVSRPARRGPEGVAGDVDAPEQAASSRDPHLAAAEP